MKTTKYAVAAALGLIALLAPTTTRADSIVQVTMSNLTFNGNNACGPSGTALCTQTLNVTFQWDNTTNTLLAGSLSFNSSGPIGTSFGSLPPVVVPGGSVHGQFPSLANNGDMVQFYIGETSNALTPGVYNLAANQFSLPLPGSWSASLSCAINVNNPFGPPPTPCGQIFYPPFAGSQNGAVASSGVVTVSAVSVGVAEPSSLLLLGTGLLGLMGMTLLRRRLD